MKSISTASLPPLLLIAVLLMIVWLRLIQLSPRFLKLCTAIAILISCVVVIKVVIVVHMLSRLMMVNDINKKPGGIITARFFVLCCPCGVYAHVACLSA
nr:MAG TPA: hypothetical protein [Bacteriophage sp.]